MLEPGETKTFALTPGKDAFAFYNDKKPAWVTEQGSYWIVAGTSSRDLRLRREFKLAQTVPRCFRWNEMRS